MLSADDFYKSIKEEDRVNARKMVGYFVYYLTVELSKPSISAGEVKECFEKCSLAVPGRIPNYLWEGLKQKPPIYLKGAGNKGYKLERKYKEALSIDLGATKIVPTVSVELRSLQDRVSDERQKAFLKEMIDCFEVEAYRAAIIMCWIFVLDSLLNYVFTNSLDAFNKVLALNTDKRIKVTKIEKVEDFADINESKIIEMMRSARIITNDVRKILDDKLGTRNSSAHPSAITMKKTKAIDFIDDLFENVYFQFQIK